VTITGEGNHAVVQDLPAIYLEPLLTKPKLRIGVMLDSFNVPAWVVKIIRDLVEAPYLDVALIIFNKAASAAQSQPLRRMRANWPVLLYKLYYRLDRKLLQANPHNAFAIEDAGPLLKGTDIVEAMPIQKKFVDRFEDADVDRIKKANLDVILRFGFRVIKGEILNCARYGIWSFHHDDNRYYRGSPPLFWEIYERNPVSGTILQVLSEKLDAGRILYRSTSATDFSWLHRNQNNTYWKTAEFVLRRLRKLYASGWDSVTKIDTYNEVIAYDKPIYRSPTNRQMLSFLTSQALRFFRSKMRSLSRDQWFLRVQRTASSGNSTTRIVDVIYPPSGRFYADPCVYSHAGRQFIFFEDYPYREKKGVISCIEIDSNGDYGPPIEVLKRDYHLSYPFLFQWQSEIYMMPETSANRTIEVYRAIEFPNKWKLHATLFSNVKAVDASLLHYRDKFWLFANIGTERSPTTDELFLFQSQSPFGPWKPHPENPIVSDVCSARPAGRFIEQDGQLIRPAQDCSRRYGYKIKFNRVDVLTETDYRETPAGEIAPDWLRGNLATHTISEDNGLQVVDGCRRISRLWPRGFSVRRIEGDRLWPRR
jgi:hypothetical protein